MPQFNTRTPAYRPTKPAVEDWNNFRKGLNLFKRVTELESDEYSQGDNIMLIGGGVPTGRWGTTKLFSGGTGSTIGIGTYVNTKTDVNHLLGFFSDGYAYKRDGATSTIVGGASFPSTTVVRTAQLGNKTFVVSPEHPLTVYQGTNFEVYTTISPPASLTATNFSGATGPNQISYKVVAVDVNGNTTTPSNNFVLDNVPFDLSTSQYKLFWTAPSAISLSAYEIYRGRPGDELFLASIGIGDTSYVDNGDPSSQTILAPITNTTGGVKTGIIRKYKDRILIVPKDDPNKLMISGRFPNQAKFSWADGGGFIYIDPDSGDDITGVEVQPIADRIVVYKNNSSYLVNLTTVQIGNFSVLDPQYEQISDYVGCSNQDTIATVGNDTFYFGRDGMYVTGYEPNFLNIIRTNEISARVRPYFETLGQTDYENACSMYVNQKYLLSFPRKKEVLVYDRERGSFAGIWKFPFGITKMQRYFDESGSEKWLVGLENDSEILTFEPSLNSDRGTTIEKTFRTGKTSFKDWTRLYIISFFYSLFRNITGSVTVNILVEDRAGVTSVAKSFTITGADTTGSTGWGIDLWGSAPYGDSLETSFVAGGEELTRWGTLFKQARLAQVEVTADQPNSNFELLGTKLEAKPQSSGSLSSTQRV